MNTVAERIQSKKCGPQSEWECIYRKLLIKDWTKETHMQEQTAHKRVQLDK